MMIMVKGMRKVTVLCSEVTDIKVKRLVILYTVKRTIKYCKRYNLAAKREREGGGVRQKLF